MDQSRAKSMVSEHEHEHDQKLKRGQWIRQDADHHQNTVLLLGTAIFTTTHNNPI